MERFADIQLLRYKLNGFESLSLQQKQYIYHLSKATLAGRDIIFDQNCEYNLAIRQLLEAVLLNYSGSRNDKNFLAFEVYLKRVWFSNGIHHHYGCEKFQPEFTREWLENQLTDELISSLSTKESIASLLEIIFNPDILPKRVNKAEGVDLIKTSACNYYKGVSQEEVEQYYCSKKKAYTSKEVPSFGLNSTLLRVENDTNSSAKPYELTWCIYGTQTKYGKELAEICKHLTKARQFAENEKQQKLIDLLISYYHSGDLRTFDDYSKLWVTEKDGEVDFINGFIEVYGDPLGYKGSWEGLVEYVDHEATKKTRLISENAQWFEDNSPVDNRFKKKEVKGVSARVICAAMLGGDEYPSTAIGINLPNADWIREEYGSKSITISNIIAAYNEAAKGSPMKREFTCDEDMIALIDKYADQCDSLHTDLHECLGHGSGQLLPNVATDALKNYFSTIEEARADLFGLYYCADEKIVELGLLPDMEAYKSMYYTYLLNGLLTQTVRIKLGDDIEEDHMRNRALIAHWALALAEKHQLSAIKSQTTVLQLYKQDGKTYLRVNDFAALRAIFAYQLAEIQRIKSEGDYEGAKKLVETYGVKINQELHKEVLERYKKLNIAPYKGFINPVLNLVKDEQGCITDVVADYTESYKDQMLRYGRGDY
ncbi:MAG: dihydrofolate reductase [Bacteroidaceae bacterium]|nr:dihydrofolate reductase [Bacteroidaceae bacterium]